MNSTKTQEPAIQMKVLGGLGPRHTGTSLLR